jgi:AraC-like DNA-binding protein
MGKANCVLASAFDFELVPPEQLGLKTHPHRFSTPAFTVWCMRKGLAGIFATNSQTVSDLKLVDALFHSLATRGLVNELLIDARGFGAEPGVFAHLESGATSWPALAQAVRKVALVLPANWSSAWWVGSMALWVPSHVRIQTFESVTLAAQALGEPPTLAHSLSELEDAVRSKSRVLPELQTLLRADPVMNIDQAARKLGISARSLQRALQQSGETFVAIRDRVRAEVAAALLSQTDSKVDAVGASVGFQSRSHFISWFRRQVGHSPGAFRKREAVR